MNHGKKEIVRPVDGIHPLPWPYSHGVRVGDQLYVAGQVALDENLQLVGADDPEAQARQAWKNIGRVVESAGGKLTDVVRVTTYLVDMRHMESIHKVRREVFPDGDFPTATMVEVSKLGMPGLLLETEVFAIIGCS